MFSILAFSFILVQYMLLTAPGMNFAKQIKSLISLLQLFPRLQFLVWKTLHDLGLTVHFPPLHKIGDPPNYSCGPSHPISYLCAFVCADPTIWRVRSFFFLKVHLDPLWSIFLIPKGGRGLITSPFVVG